MHQHRCVTDGEVLCSFLYVELIPASWWEKFQKMLLPTGRDADLGEFFRQITAVHLSGRLVKGGRSFLTDVHIDSPEFDGQLKTFLSSYPLFSLNEKGRLFRLTKGAIRASVESISDGVRRRVRNWAKQAHQHCYICGAAMDFANDASVVAFTIDHIWPTTYGGNSSLDNLLPACAACNNNKKADYASWAMCDVQSLILGIDPPDALLGDIHGSRKFALHNRAAFTLAEAKGVSLKEAFLKIGPWSDVSILDGSDVGDFFNLENRQVA